MSIKNFSPNNPYVAHDQGSSNDMLQATNWEDEAPPITAEQRDFLSKKATRLRVISKQLEPAIEGLFADAGISGVELKFEPYNNETIPPSVKYDQDGVEITILAKKGVNSAKVEEVLGIKSGTHPDKKISVYVKLGGGEAGDHFVYATANELRELLNKKLPEDKQIPAFPPMPELSQEGQRHR